MGEPIIINANDYAPGIDISNAIDYVTLQQYTHEDNSDVITYSPLVIRAAEYSPVGLPNYLSWTSLNDQYSPSTKPLNQAFAFTGLSIASKHPLNYFYFTGYNGSGDGFVMLLFDKDGNYIDKIVSIAGCRSNFDPVTCVSDSGPPCYSFSFGTFLSGRGVYRIAVGGFDGSGYINSLIFVVDSSSVSARPPTSVVARKI